MISTVAVEWQVRASLYYGMVGALSGLYLSVSNMLPPSTDNSPTFPAFVLVESKNHMPSLPLNVFASVVAGISHGDGGTEVGSGFSYYTCMDVSHGRQDGNQVYSQL